MDRSKAKPSGNIYDNNHNSGENYLRDGLTVTCLCLDLGAVLPWEIMKVTGKLVRKYFDADEGSHELDECSDELFQSSQDIIDKYTNLFVFLLTNQITILALTELNDFLLNIIYNF